MNRIKDERCKHPNREYRGMGDWVCNDCGKWLDEEQNNEAMLNAKDARIAELEAQNAALEAKGLEEVLEAAEVVIKHKRRAEAAEAELERCRDWNHAVAVCADHAEGITEREPCVVCDLAAAESALERIRALPGKWRECCHAGGSDYWLSVNAYAAQLEALLPQEKTS